MDLKKIFFAVLILGVLILVVWLIFFRKPKQQPDQTKQSEQKPAPAPAAQTEVGITMASTVSGWSKDQNNPKGSPYEQYFLTYSDGTMQIEEISKSAYELFMKEYPSGHAAGNQIARFRDVKAK